MTDYGALKAAAGRGRQVAVASDVILALLAEREEMRLLVDAIGKQREVNAAKDAQLEALCAENHAHTLRVIHANDVLLAEVRRMRAALERLGSCEAFDGAGVMDPETRARIDFARAALAATPPPPAP